MDEDEQVDTPDESSREFGTLSVSKDFGMIVLAFADGTSAEFTIDQAEAIARHITEAVKLCRMKQQMDADTSERARERARLRADRFYNLDGKVN